MLTLVIGNKNYSSWSLRAWLLLRVLDVDFEERKLKLSTDEFYREILPISPAGRVPVLLDGDFAVWDTLAIAEYVAERFPDRGVWPSDARDRARARSVCAEMHAGFGALRDAMPMNIEAHLPGCGDPPAVRTDIARITGIWEELRGHHAASGPFLFGPFGASDAFYAPVAMRFATYAVDVSEVCAGYMEAIHSLPAMAEWIAAALTEKTFLAEDEPYRDRA